MNQKAKEPKKQTPFDFVRAIRNKQAKWGDIDPAQYIPFLINRALACDLATIFQANEMNKQICLNPKAQFDFLINSIPKLSGYSPWVKGDKTESLQYIKEYYEVSGEKAREILSILSEEQVDFIKTKIMKKDTKNE